MNKSSIKAGVKYHLYKRNAKGVPLIWSGGVLDRELHVSYGTLNGKLQFEIIPTHRNKLDELYSRINAKQKEGYKFLTELKDTTDANIIKIDGMNNDNLYNYLDTYLPKYNTTSDGFVLPMLAKTLEDNIPFDKYGIMMGQWKINGLRCIIGATEVRGLFDEIHLTYHSREGVDWTSKLHWMDDIIIPKINVDLLYMMSHDGVCLDGELYLPGYSVNDINSFVKNNTLSQHYKLQYWLYDICIENMSARNRVEFIKSDIITNTVNITSKVEHLNNKEQLVVLPSIYVSNITQAIEERDKFIDLGFEGLILRREDNEYQFGKRNSSMYKFKRKDDGLFEVIDIKEDKRGLPIYVLKNDINESLFECTINLPHDKQRQHLEIKHLLIGKKGLVEFRERSGVNQVPFHSKLIKIYV